LAPHLSRMALHRVGQLQWETETSVRAFLWHFFRAATSWQAATSCLHNAQEVVADAAAESEAAERKHWTADRAHPHTHIRSCIFTWTRVELVHGVERKTPCICPCLDLMALLCANSCCYRNALQWGCGSNLLQIQSP